MLQGLETVDELNQLRGTAIYLQQSYLAKCHVLTGGQGAEHVLLDSYALKLMKKAAHLPQLVGRLHSFCACQSYELWLNLWLHGSYEFVAEENPPCPPPPPLPRVGRLLKFVPFEHGTYDCVAEETPFHPSPLLPSLFLSRHALESGFGFRCECQR